MSFHIPVYSVDRNYDENYAIALNDIEFRSKINMFLYRGYKCIVSLTPRKTWDGFVEILPSRVCYNLDHRDTRRENNDFFLDVHGGLSYSYTTDKETVLGFHTNHIGDFIPLHLKGDVNCNFNYTTFRTFDYMVKELRSLVDQLYFYDENVVDLSFLFCDE
ncbi:MAG: hypothetical protein PHG66_02055 [Candidatus Colwellbacteria bacterium]|nr:hypothetical protein [Candidatus Colwellbacteria bacterium]